MITKLLICIAIAASLVMGNSDLEQVAMGNNKFGNNFYSAIAKHEKGNIFFSPLSLHTLLALTYQGSAGETQNKLANVLNVANQNVAASGYEISMNALNTQKDVTLHMANKVYITKQTTLNRNFEEVITKSFSSDVEPIDFGESEAAANKINQWVESKTNSKIKDLIGPQHLGAATRLVLVNAVYFKGSWMYPFSQKKTTTQKFHISEKENVDCQMMHLSMPHYHRHHWELDAQILQLKYSNENISLVIVLPNKMDGIADLESKLVDVDLSTLTNDMSNMFMVNAYLPKFKIEVTMDLKPILTEMDLGIIFGSDANFSGMTENHEHLSISEAVQKTFIEVNEEGTEIAGSSGFLVYASGPKLFEANHPFIVLLQTKYEGVTNTLFYGRIMKPSYD